MLTVEAGFVILDTLGSAWKKKKKKDLQNSI